MNKLSFLFGTLTLMVFVVIDAVADMESGIIGACIFAGLEMIYTIYAYKKIDVITMISVLFVIIFAWISYHFKDPYYFKIQPAIFSAILTLVFIATQLLKKPFLVLITEKYSSLFPKEVKVQMENPIVKQQLEILSKYLCFGLILNTLMLYYSAVYLSNTVWILVKSVGLIVIMVVCMILSRKKIEARLRKNLMQNDIG